MPVKRLNYFYGQFLKENDFKDEQFYHIESLSNHNKYLHSWGIASGLDVSADRTKKHVILDEGMAMDRGGRQIILEKSMKIDIPKESGPICYLMISLGITQTDPAQETDFGGNTRILEEPLIEFGKKMPDDKSNNVFLAEIKIDPENRTISSIDKTNRKTIGLSDDIKVKSITFDQEKGQDKWPIIKGLAGKNVSLEINSRNTSLTGDVRIEGTLVAGKISGELESNMVGINQIRNESISISKIKSHKNIVTVEGTIKAMDEKMIAMEESNTHLFLVTSVIPTTPGKVEWRWQTEYQNNQLSYKLMLKNLSDKTVKYDVRYFDISEK